MLYCGGVGVCFVCSVCNVLGTIPPNKQMKAFKLNVKLNKATVEESSID